MFSWTVPIGIPEIKRMQLNRFPLLFIDTISELEPGKSARAKKCFTYNEWFFPAHFESDPNVPGFVQIECLAQTFLATFLTLPRMEGQPTAFVSIDKVRFRRKIIPGDQLDIWAELKSFRRGIATGNVTSRVGSEPACSANLVIAVPAILSPFTPR